MLVETAKLRSSPKSTHSARKTGEPAIYPIFSTINWGWLKRVKTLWIMGCWALFSTGAGFRWPIHSMSYEWTIGIFISLGEFHQEPWDLGLHHSWTNSKSRGCLNMGYMYTKHPATNGSFSPLRLPLHLAGGFNHVKKYEFVNGKDDIPYMKWKIKFMFQTTNHIYI